MHTEPGSIRFFSTPQVSQIYHCIAKINPNVSFCFSETHESAIYCVQRTFFTE